VTRRPHRLRGISYVVQFYLSIKGKDQKQFKSETKKAGRSDKFMPCIKFAMPPRSGRCEQREAKDTGSTNPHRHQGMGAASPQMLQHTGL